MKAKTNFSVIAFKVVDGDSVNVANCNLIRVAYKWFNQFIARYSVHPNNLPFDNPFSDICIVRNRDNFIVDSFEF